jgi:hypothetical protein
MKHASESTLNELSELLALIRHRPDLKERKLGIFYSRGKSFVHFHEDPLGIFADVRGAGGFTRLPVNSASERSRLLLIIDRSLREAENGRK